VAGDVSKATGLVAAIQKLVDARKEKGLRAFVVFMGGPELKDPIQKLAADKHISVPMVFLPRGAREGDVGAYKINPQAKNTILLWRQEKVQANFVDVDHGKFAPVEKAVDEMLK